MNLALVDNCPLEAELSDVSLITSAALVDVSGTEESRALNTVLGCRLYGQPTSFYMNTPYERPVRPQDFKLPELTRQLTPSAFGSPSYLAAQRLLLNRYEQDLVFLPDDEKRFDMAQFSAFYHDDLKLAAERLRPLLERHVFGWLDREIDITGDWTLAAFEKYTSDVLDAAKDAPSGLVRAVGEARDPQSAGAFYLVQCAGDFLSEASAMGRNVLGNFGTFTSELFKIFLDEYGYGLHEKKHSSIFEALMKSCGLSGQLHTYWQFYTASSISLINYFHYVSVNHGKFFRYLGAMYFTEASLAFSTPNQARAMKLAFGESVDTLYFDEHSHIDVHHGRMALEKLIKPMVGKYGVKIIPEILRGFEEFRLLQDLADEDLFRHIEWQDNLPAYRDKAMALVAGKKLGDAKTAVFDEPLGELSVMHTHPVHEHFAVESGVVELFASPFKSIVLNAGESIVIPQGILHGTQILSTTSRYRVTALECI